MLAQSRARQAQDSRLTLVQLQPRMPRHAGHAVGRGVDEQDKFLVLQGSSISRGRQRPLTVALNSSVSPNR